MRWRNSQLPHEPVEYDLQAQGWKIQVLPQTRRINRRLSGSEMVNLQARGRLHSMYKEEQEKTWRLIAFKQPATWRMGRNIGDASILPSGMVAIGSYVADDLPELARRILRLKKDDEEKASGK